MLEYVCFVQRVLIEQFANRRLRINRLYNLSYRSRSLYLCNIATLFQINRISSLYLSSVADLVP